MITGKITGAWTTGKVYINGKELSPERSLKVYNHSPTGFSWGYGGSGPAQLALALLLEFWDEEKAKRYYQTFKGDVIARLPQSNFILTVKEVRGWISKLEELLKLKAGG